MNDNNNLVVYCEFDDGRVADVSLELLTKGRTLATRLGVKLEALILGDKLDGIEEQVFPYGVDVVYKVEDERLYPYTSLPHSSIVINLFKEIKPQICLMGATVIGRDLGPRVSSCLTSGLTADCTALEIGDHTDPLTKTEYKDLLYQIRPAFGGNIVATIVNPEHRPQMATVREGVMKKEIFDMLTQQALSSRLSTVRWRSRRSTSRTRPSSWLVATAWAARRTSTLSSSSPTCLVVRWAQAVPPSTQASVSMSVRLARLV